MGCDLNKHLEHLKELLQQERDCAIQLDMKQLNHVLQEKTTLLAYIGGFAVTDDLRHRELLQQIAYENWRNARLFDQANARVKRCLGFYFRLRYPHYGSDGHVSSRAGLRHLLSGRV